MVAFPVDDETLSLVEIALAGSDERSSLVELLDLLSGVDPERSVEVEAGVYEHPDATWHANDVIAALIAEVRRLRGEVLCLDQ